MMRRKRTRARLPRMDSVSVPIDRPLWRLEIQRAAKSCTAPGEDRPDHHPEEGRQPAPDDGDRRSHDRRRPGHRGEVVPEQHVLVRRHVVDPVMELVRRRHEVGIELEHLPGDEARVDEDSGQKGQQAHHQQDDRAHRVTSAWKSVLRFVYRNPSQGVHPHRIGVLEVDAEDRPISETL